MNEICSKNLSEWQQACRGPEILKVMVDIAKARHVAAMGTTRRMLCRKLVFANSREGLKRLAGRIRACRAEGGCSRVLIGMESTGVYWKGLWAQLEKLGYQLASVAPRAMHHNRKTMGGNGSKTDLLDAHCGLDLLHQGKFQLPLRREPELEAAYRMMKHYLESRVQAGAIRNQLRSLLHLAFPELNAGIRSLQGKTALAFLQLNPTPASIRQLGPKRFFRRWRRPRGYWGRRRLEQVYELAKTGIGLPDESGALLAEIRMLAAQLARQIELQQSWFEKALSFARGRPEPALLQTIPGIREKCALGLLTAVGPARDFDNAKQWVSLAGLDLRRRDSGQDAGRRRPVISRQGNPRLRNWLYVASLNVVREPGPFQQLYERRQAASPGKGAKARALTAVSDKLARVMFAMLRDQRAYDAGQDERTAQAYRSKGGRKQRAA